MATRAGTYSNDLHLYPLYLKWSAESFRNGNISDGTSFFNAVCCSPRKLERELEYKVYKQIWKLKGRPKGDGEFGRKSFQGTTGGFSSTALEKAQALENAIRKVDQNELSMRENQVHKCLWIIHGQPAGDEEYGKHAFYSTHGRSSSIMNKLSAARMYADQSRALTWLTNNAEVRLIKRADGKLERLAIDSGLGQYGSQIIDIGRQSLENAISVLSNCIATVNGGNVAFTFVPDKIFMTFLNTLTYNYLEV